MSIEERGVGVVVSKVSSTSHNTTIKPARTRTQRSHCITGYVCLTRAAFKIADLQYHCDPARERRQAGALRRRVLRLLLRWFLSLPCRKLLTLLAPRCLQQGKGSGEGKRN